MADLVSESVRTASGETIPLRPQAFATLRYLLANPNRLVTKSELSEAVWRGVAVTGDSLVQCIHEIRRALNDDRHVVLQTVPRRGYRLVLPGTDAPQLPDKPSIAVLPFSNLSDDSGQDYFADGLAEDVITNLAKIPGLFVIARNSSFAYRGESRDMRKIAAELGVRYLLEGSVRRSGSRLRISGRLIDGANAGQIWASKFEGAAEDVFDLQDQFTEQIAGAIEPSVRRAEIDRARRKRPESLNAYDLYLRALPHAYANTPAETDKALKLLNRCLELDPAFASAHGYAAWCREQRYFRNGFHPEDRVAALAHAEAALGIFSSDPQAISMAAFVRANLTRDYEGAIADLDRALAMNENSALALGFSALAAAHSERHERAIDHARRALRLSPLDDPLNYHPYCALAVTHLFTQQYAEAVRYSMLTIRMNPVFSVPHAYLVASYIGLGNVSAARGAAQRLLEVAPAFTIEGFVRMDLFRAQLMKRLAAALEAAGLPLRDGP